MIRRLIKFLPPGLLEEPKEFLVSASLVLTGFATFLLPFFQNQHVFDKIPIPVGVILAWGVFFSLGGILTCAGLLLRRSKYWLVPRMIESVGLTLLSTALLSYVAVAIAVGLGSLVTVCILIALGLGFAIKVALLFPGVYETILINEVDREVKKLTRNP